MQEPEAENIAPRYLYLFVIGSSFSPTLNNKLLGFIPVLLKIILLLFLELKATFGSEEEYDNLRQILN